MAWEHGFVLEIIPKISKKTSCKNCDHYDSSDYSCSKKGYYLPVDGYDRWKTCEYSTIKKPSGKPKKNSKSSGKPKDSAKTKSKEANTKAKKQESKANTTTVNSYGSIELKTFTVPISGASRVKPASASIKQKENKKSTNKNDTPSNKSFQLVCGYKFQTLPKDVRDKLETRRVYIPMRKNNFKCTVGYDHSAKKAYLFTYLAHKPFTELKKQFKSCTIYKKTGNK